MTDSPHVVAFPAERAAARLTEQPTTTPATVIILPVARIDQASEDTPQPDGPPPVAA